MRVRLSLEAEPGSSLSLNYHYQLSSAIYHLLRLGSPEFATYLHDTGFPMAGKTYKLFTFALRAQNIRAVNGQLLLPDGKAQLYVSTPLIDTFIGHLLSGSFQEQNLLITSGYRRLVFSIALAEVLPEPDFAESMNFTLYSPMVLSTGQGTKENGRLRQHFLRPEEPEEINRVLSQNLYNKAILLGCKFNTTPNVQLTWSASYLASKGRITKKITIDENSKNAVEVIGIQAPFTITGNKELLRAGYLCGFGEKNSTGFGFAAIDGEKHFRNVSFPRGGN